MLFYAIIIIICLILVLGLGFKKCAAHQQLDGFQCNLQLCSIFEHFPISTVTVDHLGYVRHTSLRRDKPALMLGKIFLGKNIFKIAARLLANDELNRFISLVSPCMEQGVLTELRRLKVDTASGFTEYFTVKAVPQADRRMTLLIFINTTEEVLLEEEFTRLNTEFAASHQDLTNALSNLDLYVMDRERVHNDLASLHRIITLIKATSGSIEEVLHTSLQAISSQLGYTRCAIYLSEENGSLMIKRASMGFDDDSEEGCIPEVLPASSAYHSSHITTGVDYLPKLIIPLTVHNSLFGCLYIESCFKRRIMPHDVELLNSVATHVAMVIDHIQHDLLVERLAITDGLTGLYNHRFFREQLTYELKRSDRYKFPTSLIMLDIDNFKLCNDNYGHSEGDLVLKQIGQLLQKHCRETDWIARYGGEEFAIIMPETPVKTAAVIAERLRRIIKEHAFKLQSYPDISVSVSLGVGGFPNHAVTDEMLIKAADKALYTAKQKKNCVHLYSNENMD